MRKQAILRVIITLVCLSGLWTYSNARDASTAALDPALERIRPQAIRAHMRFLADDLLEGRGTGTRGYQLAAKYVAAQFETLGLEPAGTDGNYFQPVPLRKLSVIASESRLVLVREGKEEILTYGKDYLFSGDRTRTKVHVEADVVFAGFGVTAPELGYDDYAGLDVRGKIVAMLSGAPESFPVDQRAYYTSPEAKDRNAIAHGVAGVVLCFTPEFAQIAPWEMIVMHSKMGEICWLDQEGMPHLNGLAASPEIRGVAALSRAGAEALFDGAPQTLEAVFAAKNKPPTFALPTKVRMETATVHKPLKCANVVAILRGSDPQLREECVVFTAHLDHLGIGEPIEGDGIFNGAVDNASGVAALIEIARAFVSLPRAPRRSIVFLADTGEEMGLLGSDYFMYDPPVPSERIVVDINIDCAVSGRPVLDIIACGAEHSSLGSVVEEAASQLKLTVSPDPMPEQVTFIRGDHYSFIRWGVPALYIFQGSKTTDPAVDRAALTSEWYRTVYHTPKDDLHQPLDFGGGAKLAQIDFLIGHQIASVPQRPKWNSGDFFGTTFGGQ